MFTLNPFPFGRAALGAKVLVYTNRFLHFLFSSIFFSKLQSPTEVKCTPRRRSLGSKLYGGAALRQPTLHRGWGGLRSTTGVGTRVWAAKNRCVS